MTGRDAERLAEFLAGVDALLREPLRDATAYRIQYANRVTGEIGTAFRLDADVIPFLTALDAMHCALVSVAVEP